MKTSIKASRRNAWMVDENMIHVVGLDTLPDDPVNFPEVPEQFRGKVLQRGQHPMWEIRATMPANENVVKTMVDKVGNGLPVPQLQNICLVKQWGLLMVFVGRRRVINIRAANAILRARGNAPMKIFATVLDSKSSKDEGHVMRSALVSNAHVKREDAITTARNLHYQLEHCGYTPESLAIYTQTSSATIRNMVTLLILPDHIQDMISFEFIQLSDGYAMARALKKRKDGAEVIEAFASEVSAYLGMDEDERPKKGPRFGKTKATKNASTAKGLSKSKVKLVLAAAKEFELNAGFIAALQLVLGEESTFDVEGLQDVLIKAGIPMDDDASETAKVA